MDQFQGKSQGSTNLFWFDWTESDRRNWVGFETWKGYQSGAHGMASLTLPLRDMSMQWNKVERLDYNERTEINYDFHNKITYNHKPGS